MNRFFTAYIRISARPLRQGRFRLPAAVLALSLAACTSTSPHADAAPPEVEHEYLVYRIDDHRYITIRASGLCDGYIQGDIYYNDTREGVRTFVSFTGPMNNGLYRDYYAVHSNPQYIAIPSIAYSDFSREESMHIDYSHDGGRTFQWFASGHDSPDFAVILDGKNLYSSIFLLKKSLQGFRGILG